MSDSSNSLGGVRAARYDYSKPQNDRTLSNKSKCAIIAFAVGGVAGIVIVILGGMRIFGAIGSGGFIASMVVGNSLICVSIGAIIVVVRVKNRTPLQSNVPSTGRTTQRPKYSSVSKDANKGQKSQESKLHPEDQTTKQPNLPSDEIRGVGSQVPIQASQAPSPYDVTKEQNQYEARRDEFRRAVRLKKKPEVPFEMPNDQNEDFRLNAREAIKGLYQLPTASHVKVFGGGEHRCVTTDKIPEVIFKRESGLTPSLNMTPYVTLADKARKICEEYGLDLLYVPKCKVVDFNHSVVMQEKVELFEGDDCADQARYQWAVYDPELREFIKKQLIQILIFTCVLRFVDVKYDNLKHMKDGRVALYDLDEATIEEGDIRGLTAGRAKFKQCGLFRMIPLEWFEEFVAIARKHLLACDYKKLEAELPSMREKAVKRGQRRENKERFYNSRGITLPTQPLAFDMNLLSQYMPEVLIFAKTLEGYLNREIPTLSTYLSMIVGRTTEIKINVGDLFPKSYFNDPFFNSQKIAHSRFYEIAKGSLRALKEKGCIYSYKINTNYNWFTVVY